MVREQGAEYAGIMEWKKRRLRLLSILLVGLWLGTGDYVASGAAKAPAPTSPVRVQQKALPQKHNLGQKETPTGQAPDTRHVTIDFDNVDIAFLIKFISELTGLYKPDTCYITGGPS